MQYCLELELTMKDVRLDQVFMLPATLARIQLIRWLSRSSRRMHQDSDLGQSQRGGWYKILQIPSLRLATAKDVLDDDDDEMSGQLATDIESFIQIFFNMMPSWRDVLLLSVIQLTDRLLNTHQNA